MSTLSSMSVTACLSVCARNLIRVAHAVQLITAKTTTTIITIKNLCKCNLIGNNENVAADGTWIQHGFTVAKHCSLQYATTVWLSTVTMTENTQPIDRME